MAGQYTRYPVLSGGGGSGTVTSVALSAPSSILTVSGSPVTTAGTLALTLATQAANKIWAGPATGSAATPTFRSLVAADFPVLGYLTSINSDTTAAQIIAAASTGTDFTIATVAGTTTIAIPSASATARGLVTPSPQTFAGDKTFTGNLVATGTVTGSNLSGTNTGDVTLGAVGSSANANGASLSGQILTLQPATTSFPGALTATDWNTFNGKQAAGNYITALTGDATAAGPGSAALTLATVNSNVGSFGTASATGAFTVNAKGLVTAASSTSIQIAESQVTNLVSDLAGKQAIGNYITALTGDATAAGPGSAALTLATVATPGTSTKVTYNAKGLVTSGTSAVLASSDFANQGTTTTVLHGNAAGNPSWAAVSLTADVTGALPLVNGGTGTAAGSANAAFNALSPLTTGGDLIYGGASGVGTRLPNGSTGQVLTSGGGTAAPSWTSNNKLVSSQVTLVSGTYSVTATDVVLMVDTSAARSITLPTPFIGFLYIKDKTGSSITNPITLIRNGSEMIEGVAASRVLTGNYDTWHVFGNGTDWWLF